jgi:glycosyltransferase 2 family protein
MTRSDAPPRRRSAWPAVRLAAGAAILAALVAHVGTAAFTAGLAAIGPGAVVAALVLGLLTTVVSAARWCLVARGLGLALPLPEAVADCYRALFLNSVLPAGVLGDVHRAVGYGRRIGDVRRGVRVVALERVTGQLAVVVVAVAVLLAARPALLADAVDAVLPASPVAVGLLAALLLALAVDLACGDGPRARRFRAALATGLRTGLADVRGGVLARGTWPGLLLLSVAALGGYLALFVVAARTAGSDAALGLLLPLLVLGLLAMALPLNVGGWGPREGATAVAFGAAGLGAGQGVTVAVVYGVLSLVACLPGAVVLLLAHRFTPIPAERSPA